MKTEPNYFTIYEPGMKATNRAGHEWTGEREGVWWNYLDTDGDEYQSREIPAYYVVMDNAVIENGAISPKP